MNIWLKYALSTKYIHNHLIIYATQPPITQYKVPIVTINEPEGEAKRRSSSSLSEVSVASSYNPSPITAIREEGGSINEAFIMDSDSNDNEDKDEQSNEQSDTREMLI